MPVGDLKHKQDPAFQFYLQNPPWCETAVASEAFYISLKIPRVLLFLTCIVSPLPLRSYITAAFLRTI